MSFCIARPSGEEGRAMRAHARFNRPRKALEAKLP